MKKITVIIFLMLFALSFQISAQIPLNNLVQIVKAEDERRFDKTLENLLKSRNAAIRTRAALAAGRIGDERAVDALAAILAADKSDETHRMAAFALGEIESVKGADAILQILSNTRGDEKLRALAVEAAGKIAAANAKDASAAVLGKAIIAALGFENQRRSMPSGEMILAGLTAVLRARPDGGEQLAASFLHYSSPRIRADALNTLSRLKAKSADSQARELLVKDEDATVRANAARVLGAAEDQDSFDALQNAAVKDADSRVRVSAIRALGSLKNKSAAENLMASGEKLLTAAKAGKIANPPEKSELLEIASALGRILPNTDDKRAVEFLDELHQADHFTSPETEIALARVAPKIYLDALVREADGIFHGDWRASSAAFQALAEFANLPPNADNDALKSRTRILLAKHIGEWFSLSNNGTTQRERLAIPDLIQAFAAFKSENISGIFRPMLEIEPDIFIRAALAAGLAEQTANAENVAALSKAFDAAYLNDKTANDAQLAILDAMFKLDKKNSIPTLLIAVLSKDYLVRKKASEMLEDESYKGSYLVELTLAKFAAAKRNQVLPYNYGSKLGQLNNTQADYVRAVSRKNGSVRAILTTEKGAFTIEFTPEDAPLTVDNFIKLAKAHYFDGLEVHRVVPNFVMQDGDPRGDGNGGPGWEIRCEINLSSYERGAVGMALSGKDTGGSQWFVTHSPQPHLDGGYTVFGRVNESDMKIVDSIVRGDKILSVKIIGK